MSRKITTYILILSSIIMIIVSLNLPYWISTKDPISDINKSYKDHASANKSNENNENEVRNIYLTFDDGPSEIITDKILDVLKENNVKATFFIVGKEIKGREDILKRIYNEGNGIGLHTYSHSFKKIYSNHDAFIDEMRKTSDSIYEILKIRPTIIRFPGGSHNRLNDEFLDELHNNNFKIYDWTNNTEDGVNASLPVSKLYKNSLKRIISKKKFPGIILLMHCNQNNSNTYRALPKIISHYKDLGYEFKVITDKTPEYISE